VGEANGFWRVQKHREGCPRRSYGVHKNGVHTIRSFDRFSLNVWCAQIVAVAIISRGQRDTWPAMRTRRCKRTSATPRISIFLLPMQDRCVHGPSGEPSARIHAVRKFIRVVHLLRAEYMYPQPICEYVIRRKQRYICTYT
jgi:hypothetical protein